MYIGLFEIGNGFSVKIIPSNEVKNDFPAASALSFVKKEGWTQSPGWRGLFLKVGGQL